MRRERLQDFVAKILFVERSMRGEDRSAVSRLDWIRHAAQMQVLHNFNRRKNLTPFGNGFCSGPRSGFPPTPGF